MTTNAKYNKYFILKCIEKSVKKLKTKPEFKGIEFIIQEGITGESGSVKVAQKIVDERIPNCDIFIADLSVVNHINKFGKFIRKISGDKYKPFQNSNVFYEYGVAYEAIGEERIIGVLNNSYGSPNDNPDNIPFDIKHLRFPLEYSFSPQSNDKEKAQVQLITGLTGAIKETAIYALNHQKDKYKPLSVWSEWESLTNTTQKFYINEIITNVTAKIIEGVRNPNESIRLIGLSGLGKTRMLLETFRRVDTDYESVLLNGRVLYLNCNLYPQADYQSIFSKLTKEKEDRIVILDNCSRTLHRQLLHFINNENNLISLITIDSNPEELEQDKINGVNYIQIKKEDLSSVVDDILNEELSVLGKDKVEKIKEFSQGIPLMAVLLSDSLKKGEKFIGRLGDKELLNNLLGSKGTDAEFRKVLLSCSIFHYFGFEGELRPQLEYIASNKDITSLSGENQVIINTFDEVCNHYLKREIFERRGRFLSMRPFPLAMSLAQEWLEHCSPDRLVRVITSIANLQEPHRKNLSEALAEQMKFLGYNDKALSIIDNIVGPNCPFDNAEVLNTELGSRLFRSFVEVNPVAVSDNLVRQFSEKTKDELLNIKEGRRNLVWVLEKLCFDKRTFSDSIKILFSFAVAENETWSNNATGQFLQLFNVQLAGTEADLTERWKIIEWGLNKDDKEYRKLSLKAMGVGLGFGHASRVIGAEIQGTKKLEDYIPTFSAVKEYWNHILDKLTEMIISTDEEVEFASKTICNNLRGICRARLTDILFPYLNQLIEYKNNDWDELLNSLKLVKNYEKSFLSNEQFTRIEYYIKLLTKNDFLTRYLTASKSHYIDDDDSYSSEKIINLLEKLADEFITSNLSWAKYFPVFYKNPQVYSYHFGKRIYSLLKNNQEKVKEFFRYSVSVIASIDKNDRNVLVLGGFINESSEKQQEEFYNLLFNSELNYLLFYFISLNPKGKKYLGLLHSLVEDNKCEVSHFNSFLSGNALENMELKELEDFSLRLFKYSKEGYIVIFNLFFSLGFRNKELRKKLVPTLENCIIELGITIINENKIDDYKWTETICYILNDKSKKDFARFINKSIIESISFNNYLHLDHYIQRIYEILLGVHFHIIWPDLSHALLSQEEEYEKFFGLKHIIGSHIGGVSRSVGVLFYGDIDSIFEWCHMNTPLAPSRLAELVPIYGNDNSGYSDWHPIALRLIDEFGNISDVLSNLSSNMGTFSWTGSLVPLLEAKKELFKKIRNHKLNAVAEWAERNLKFTDDEIRIEKIRDEEMYL